ncbi:MAG: lipoyl synthase [Bacteroidales bacterium]|nr:lipoyl synthase [Bacteroidales bacterium]
MLQRKPEWLRIELPKGELSLKIRQIVNKNSLHTICESGLCPNRAECHGCGTATLMIGGDICTRACKFCNVRTGKPLPLDSDEPVAIAESIEKLKLKHVVLTSVDRDDLPDLGANHWGATIRAVKKACPAVTMETLIPDFQGRVDLLDIVIDAKPEVISHNLETVKRLTPAVRSRATYNVSLAVLKHIAERGLVAKSGIMLGLGETEAEILQTMDDLLQAGCSVMTIGQYLQPSAKNIPVSEYVHPDTFARYRQAGVEKGFRHVESGPFVRSSYHAEKHAK